MTRPVPGRMRLVPEVATEEMTSALHAETPYCHAEPASCRKIIGDRTCYQAAADSFRAALDAAPSAGLVSREMVDAMTEAACASYFGISWADFATGNRRMSLRNMREALLAALTVAGLAVAPAADTARNGEAE